MVIILNIHSSYGDTSAVKYQKSSKYFDWPLDWCPVFASSNNSRQSYTVYEEDTFKLQDIFNLAF